MSGVWVCDMLHGMCRKWADQRRKIEWAILVLDRRQASGAIEKNRQWDCQRRILSLSFIPSVAKTGTWIEMTMTHIIIMLFKTWYFCRMSFWLEKIFSLYHFRSIFPRCCGFIQHQPFSCERVAGDGLKPQIWRHFLFRLFFIEIMVGTRMTFTFKSLLIRFGGFFKSRNTRIAYQFCQRNVTEQPMNHILCCA